MSTLDPNGVLVYDEADTRGTFSELLNMGQAATSDAIGADRSRLSALEAKDNLGPVSAAAFTAETGWQITEQAARQKNGICYWMLKFKRTGGSITIPGDGDAANQRVATIGAGWAPAPGMDYPASGGAAGPVAQGAVWISSGTWVVNLVAIAPGSTINTGTALSFVGMYPLA